MWWRRSLSSQSMDLLIRNLCVFIGLWLLLTSDCLGAKIKLYKSWRGKVIPSFRKRRWRKLAPAMPWRALPRATSMIGRVPSWGLCEKMKHTWIWLNNLTKLRKSIQFGPSYSSIEITNSSFTVFSLNYGTRHKLSWTTMAKFYGNTFPDMGNYYKFSLVR